MPKQSFSLEEQIQDFLSKVLDKSIVVAYSGGLDSMVLLHLISRYINSKTNLKAIYINHGIQPSSNDWAVFCQKECNLLNVHYQYIDIELIDFQGKGLEATAREQRYLALFNEMTSGNVLVTGHHLKDQAETTLMALMRGSGASGLAAMPVFKSIKKGDKDICHYRPLLYASESSLRDYAKQHNLSWVEDPSNNSLSFKRNFVRHKVLPILEQGWPTPIENIVNSASLMSESLSLMDDLAKLDLQEVLINKICLSLFNLNHLSWVRHKNIVRYWFSKFLPIQLNATILNWLKDCLENENPEALPILQLSVGKLRFYNKCIYFLSDSKEEYSVPLSEFKFINFKFSNNIHNNFSLSLACSQSDKAVVRNICKQDDIDFKALKKWFKRHKIPPWERKRWPVVELNNKVIAVLGRDNLNN